MGDDAARERVRRNVKRAMDSHEPPLNAAQLSRRAGTDVKTIRALLSGERWPHPDTLTKIVHVGLGVDLDTLDGWLEGTEVFTIVPAVEPGPPARTIDEATDAELVRALLARIEARGVTE